MKKKIYFIISSILQMIGAIIALVNVQALVQASIKSIQEVYAMFPVELQERMIANIQNNGANVYIFMSIVILILNGIMVIYAINNSILKKKGWVIAFSVICFFMSTNILVQTFSLVNFIVILCLRRKNSEDYPSKEKKKIHFFSLPSAKISIIYYAISTISIIAISLVIPLILNYPPDSINTPFDIQMSYISYNTQFFALATLIILGIVISHKISLHEVDTWYSDTDKSKFTDIKRLQKIRNKCITLPYIYFAVEIILPSTIAFILLSITGSHSDIMIGKVILLLGSFSLLLAVVSFIFS